MRKISVEKMMTIFYQLESRSFGYPEIQKMCDSAIKHLKAIKKEQDAIPLNPCPFCGGKAKIIQDETTCFYKVRCEKCYVELGDYDEKSIVVEKWNRRTKE